ncbi:hypothetical protein HOY82DRAFT_480634 [Tuber indicum]|nr:hypothetical protein HOY82DRAFT_480634 [Tuber indicum]
MGTTSSAIACWISKCVFKTTDGLTVNGNPWDLERPFEKFGAFEPFDFEDSEGE